MKPAKDVIEIVDFFGRAPIVPQNCRTDDVVGFIQRDKAVHLAARADARDQFCVKAAQQLGNAGHNCIPPILGLLLRPAGVREDERILVRDLVHDRASFIHQQQLARGRAEIDTDKIHGCLLFRRSRRGRLRRNIYELIL